MNPRLKKHFYNFKQRFEIEIPENYTDKQKTDLEASAFEKFVNFLIFSIDYPDVFSGEVNLLNTISVGGQGDTKLDGIGIRVNNLLVKSLDEVREIIKNERQIEYDFIFIQSKMQERFDATEFSGFIDGIKHFLSPSAVLPENPKVKNFRAIKDFFDSDEFNKNPNIKVKKGSPNLYIYYVSMGNQPTDEHFLGTKEIKANELNNLYSNYFNKISISLIDGNTIINYCDELDNNFEVKINILEAFPLYVGNNDKIKKAWAFTCSAKEFLEVLTKKEDDSLRKHLFNDNVRDYLGNKKGSSINGEIEKSIIESPEMFLLRNNGITIVCSDYNSVKDKLVQIDNPQIVNGCQTSNSIFNQRNHPNIDQVKLLVRLICTDDPVVANSIVRGTNKQNQVLEEDFEVTLPFHQDYLEPFFLSFEHSPQLYYERRHKQYMGSNIPSTRIVNLRILCQTFAATFLNVPHEAYRHQKKILELFGGDKSTRKIFVEGHSEYPYYTCAVIWYMFEKNIYQDEYSEFEKFRYHLYLIMRHFIGEEVPSLSNAKHKIEKYCNNFLEILGEKEFRKNLDKAISVFQELKSNWIKQGNSSDGIKDVPKFTETLLLHCKKTFLIQPTLKENIETTYEGIVKRIISKSDGLWYCFIDCQDLPRDIYFDSRAYRGKIEDIKLNQSVKFTLLTSSEEKITAKEVKINKR